MNYYYFFDGVLMFPSSHFFYKINTPITLFFYVKNIVTYMEKYFLREKNTLKKLNIYLIIKCFLSLKEASGYWPI